MKKEKIPHGYKDSLVGIIPDDWEVRRLGEVCAKITDGTHDTPIKQEVGVPFLTAIHVKDGKIDYEGCYYVSKNDHESIYKRCNPEFGDVLMVNIGAGVLSVAMNRTNKEFSLKNVALLKPLKQELTGVYLEAALLNNKLKNANCLLNGGAQSFLGLSDISKIKILIPPLDEQKAIADVLSTWDVAIEKTEQLIQAKENRFKWLLKTLISDQQYAKEKLKVAITEVSVRNKELAITQVLSVTNKKGFVFPEEQFERQVASSDLSNYKIVTKGDYAYNPSRINVGSIARLDKWNEGILSPMYTVFEVNSKILNSDYLLHWLSTHEAKERIKLGAQGSVRESVSFDDFSRIKILMPPLEEQQRIAETLSTAQAEINLLKQLAEKYKTQKRGLMQQLLTGKTRVGVELTK